MNATRIRTIRSTLNEGVPLYRVLLAQIVGMVVNIMIIRYVLKKFLYDDLDLDFEEEDEEGASSIFKDLVKDENESNFLSHRASIFKDLVKDENESNFLSHRAPEIDLDETFSDIVDVSHLLILDNGTWNAVPFADATYANVMEASEVTYYDPYVEVTEESFKIRTFKTEEGKGPLRGSLAQFWAISNGYGSIQDYTRQQIRTRQ